MRLSIISINYNNVLGLKRTIESVLMQTFHDYEYIIIDGGSTDGSIDVIKQFQNKITYWVSEKDTGVYNAMNKGIKQATGDYFFFLNSGDVLVDNTVFEKINPYLSNTDIVYGDLIIRESNKDWVKHYNEKLTFEYFTRDTLPHQAAFIRRGLFLTNGLYDEAYKICADWKFFMDAVCKYAATVKYVPEIISIYDYSGLSSVPQNWDKIKAEKDAAFKKDYPYYIDTCMELQELKKMKAYYQLVNKDFFVRNYLAMRFRFSWYYRLLKKKLSGK